MVTKVIHRVNFYDTDAMAVVHHANYIKWFEMGRVEFLRQAGITLGELIQDGFLFPITDVSCKYLCPAIFDDVLLIHTKPMELTKAKMSFTYRIIRQTDEQILVKGTTQNVFTDKVSGRIKRLPGKYYERLIAAL